MTTEVEPDDEPAVVPLALTESENDDAEPCVDDVRMTLGEHLEELRARLIVCVAAVSLLAVVGLIFYQQLWHFIHLPLREAAAYLDVSPDELVPIRFSAPTAGISLVGRLVVYSALALASPLLVYQLWAFVRPGLTRRERRAATLVFTAGSGLFFAGMAMGYFFIAPLGLAWLVPFNAEFAGAGNLWDMGEYISFVLTVCVAFGACFELPLVMLALAWTGLITPEGILRYWRHALLAISVAGAAFTPPDPVTMVLLAGVLMGLFVLGYFLARWAAPKGLSS